MKYAIKFYSQISNPASVPEEWPAVVLEVNDEAKVPDGFTGMTASELALYKSERQAMYDAWLSSYVAAELPSLKQLRYQDIDKRTDELISNGFEFPPGSGLVFNLSQESQIRFHGCDYARDLLSYPIQWQTLDDNSQLSVTDATMMHNFFLSAFSALRSLIDSGTALKKQIADATTKAEVDAVVDTR